MAQDRTLLPDGAGRAGDDFKIATELAAVQTLLTIAVMPRLDRIKEPANTDKGLMYRDVQCSSGVVPVGLWGT
jgi:hypothetical protein